MTMSHMIYWWKEINCPTTLTKIIEDWLQDRKIEWVNVKGICQLLDNNRGVPQGAILSPLLYNLYVSGIKVEVYNGLTDEQGDTLNLQPYMYADDIALVAWNKKGDTAKSNLETAVLIIREELKKIKLKMSEEKTQIIKFQDKEQRIRRQQETFLTCRGNQGKTVKKS